MPRTTDSPVHCMPARTWPSGMIGSPAARGRGEERGRQHGGQEPGEHRPRNLAAVRPSPPRWMGAAERSGAAASCVGGAGPGLGGPDTNRNLRDQNPESCQLNDPPRRARAADTTMERHGPLSRS